MSATSSLLEVFSQLEDPRKARGVRHPFSGIVALTVLGMLARIREMEVLVRWATVHWDSLRAPLGFDRDEPPCATTISRTLAKCSVDEFQKALNQRLRHHVAEGEGVLAVDGKTAKQGIDSDGNPLHMLNAFVVAAIDSPDNSIEIIAPDGDVITTDSGTKPHVATKILVGLKRLLLEFIHLSSTAILAILAAAKILPIELRTLQL